MSNELGIKAQTIGPAESYGLAIDITNLRQEYPGPYTADVVVTYNGQRVEMTYEEFARRLGL